MNEKDHDKFVADIKANGVHAKYDKTFFGNYSQQSVLNFVAECLDEYREAELEARRIKRRKK